MGVTLRGAYYNVHYISICKAIICYILWLCEEKKYKNVIYPGNFGTIKMILMKVGLIRMRVSCDN